jgi:hypothetical protein
LDSLHVPLVAAGMLYSLQVDTWALVVVGCLNSSIYLAQLLVYHYQLVFIQTSGVEAQIGTSGLYILAGILSTMDRDELSFNLIITLASVVAAITCLQCHGDFVHRFNRTMVEKFLLFTALSAAFGTLHLMGALGRVQFLLIISFVSFRITGCYVMYSILQKQYKGYDGAIFAWLAAIVWGHFFMAALPMSTLFSALLPYTGDFFFGLTVQQMLPWCLCAHLGQRNLAELNKNYYVIKKM